MSVEDIDADEAGSLCEQEVIPDAPVLHTIPDSFSTTIRSPAKQDDNRQRIHLEHCTHNVCVKFLAAPGPTPDQLRDLDGKCADHSIPTDVVNDVVNKMGPDKRQSTVEQIGRYQKHHYQNPEVSMPLILRVFAPEPKQPCCPICKEVVNNSSTLQCGHTYCHNCIFKWLAECDNRCPQCRTPAVCMTDSAGATLSVPVTRSEPPDPGDVKTAKVQSLSDTTLYEQDAAKVVRALACRDVGRNAILNSPIVVRAITSAKRQSRREATERQDENLRRTEKKASHAKGRITSMAKKMCRIQAMNKGLRTQMAKVVNTLNSCMHALIKISLVYILIMFSSRKNVWRALS